MKIIIDEELCKGCQLCVEMCPAGVLERSGRLSARGYHLPSPAHPEKCRKCYLCVMYCPDFAIQVVDERKN